MNKNSSFFLMGWWKVNGIEASSSSHIPHYLFSSEVSLLTESSALDFYLLSSKSDYI